MRKSDKFEIELYDGAICFEGTRVTYKSGSYSMPTDDCVLSLSQIDSLAEYFSGIERKEILIDSALSKLTNEEKEALGINLVVCSDGSS